LKEYLIMSWFSETVSSVSDALSEVDPTNPNSAVSDALRAVDPTLLVGDTQALLEPMAMPLAQQWKSDHPAAQSDSQSDIDDCVTVVASGLVAAGAAMGSSAAGVGAIIGAAIGAGAGIPAARLACRRIFE
jgi:hypothetical protein